MNNELFSHAATVFQVSDMAKSLAFYRDQIGFSITFEWGNPIDYAVLKRGDVSLHLARQEGYTHHNKDRTSLYIFVNDVDAMYKELLDKGISTASELVEQDYGMKDFDISDPDGYRICFGKGG